MKRIVMVLAVVVLALSLQAGAVELREDHPREYVVQPGDTLWDIASKFLTRPWQWPNIWQANPEIENPHLIYPGDVISLVFIGGEPRLMVDDSIKKLSPRIRSEAIDGPITTLPRDAIEPFLRRPRVLDAEEIEDLPYIIANYEHRVMVGIGDRTYARGMADKAEGEEVIIARMVHQFVDRSEAIVGDRGMRRNRIRTGTGAGQVPYSERPSSEFWLNTVGKLEAFDYPIIGYEFLEAARAVVLRAGDPAVLEIVEGRREVMAGDRVLPIDDFQLEETFFPRAMDETPEGGRILTLSEAYYGAGHYQIVAINLGTEDGVQPGHMFSAFRPGDVMRDNIEYPRMSRAAFESPERVHVELPEEFAGQLMVFRPFDRISYAIILDGTNAIRVDDRLDHPDRRL
ncbi:LysM peptidoglycan-binding domain-containing protein [Wenzhouxiangella limi]|uniref:LysM peptidoglycan-binding domain-containing protein n=1 Tax=Wenzhouxiangella limi TaxID=2707351 RepID=A0A845V6S9_9GAMM|nr:LysM peptidoglycan-binding domain-containing protein [Wenzhouxiangella limi]